MAEPGLESGSVWLQWSCSNKNQSVDLQFAWLHPHCRWHQDVGLQSAWEWKVPTGSGRIWNLPFIFVSSKSVPQFHTHRSGYESPGLMHSGVTKKQEHGKKLRGSSSTLAHLPMAVTLGSWLSSLNSPFLPRRVTRDLPIASNTTFLGLLGQELEIVFILVGTWVRTIQSRRETLNEVECK